MRSGAVAGLIATKPTHRKERDEWGTRQTPLRLLPDPYRIREESRKVWKHCNSNEVVHFSEVIKAEVETFISIIDCQLRPTVWIEFHFSLVGQWDSYYCAIIDLLVPDFLDSGHFELPLRKYAVGSDVPMFLNIPQFVESPQMSRAVVVPSVIRLKRFDNGNGICGHSSSRSPDEFPGVGIVSFTDGEANFGTRDGATQEGQLPCKMIQASPQIQNEVPGHQGSLQHSGIVETLNPNDIPAIFRIVLGRNLWGVQLLDNKRFACKFVEVFLRPLQFKIRIEQARHDGSLRQREFIHPRVREGAKGADVRREQADTLKQFNRVQGAALEHPDAVCHLYSGKLDLATPINNLALLERTSIVNILVNDDPLTNQRLIAKDGHYNLQVP